MRLSPARLAIAAASIGSVAAAQVELTLIEGHDQRWVTAMGLSDDGRYVAVSGYFNEVYRFDRVSNTLEILSLDQPARGQVKISADGMTIAATRDTLGVEGWKEAAIWREGEGWTDIGRIPNWRSMDGSVSTMYDLSGDGTTITGLAWNSNGRGHAFKWTEETGMVDLGVVPDNDNSSRGNVVNHDGSIVAGWNRSALGGHEPAIWKDGAYESADPGQFSEVRGMNPAGDILGGSGRYQEGAVLWTWSGSSYDRTIIGWLPGSATHLGNSATLDISDTGVAVGFNIYSFQPGTGQEAWLWDEQEGMRKLVDVLDANEVDYGDFYFASVNAITPDGAVMVGWGLDLITGRHKAFVVDFDPQAPCQADMNGDGVLDFFDVSSFLTLYAAQDPAADFTGDGIWDFFDVSMFLTLYAQGCP